MPAGGGRAGKHKVRGPSPSLRCYPCFFLTFSRVSLSRTHLCPASLPATPPSTGPARLTSLAPGQAPTAGSPSSAHRRHHTLRASAPTILCLGDAPLSFAKLIPGPLWASAELPLPQEPSLSPRPPLASASQLRPQLPPPTRSSHRSPVPWACLLPAEVLRKTHY